MKPFLTINKVLSLVVQEEKQEKYGVNAQSNVKSEETNPWPMLLIGYLYLVVSYCLSFR